MGKLSPEAARAKYEYNKKYQKRYWEKKAAKQAGSHPLEPSEDEAVSVSRTGRTDARYITALETSNKVLNSEIRRLVNLLQDYQKMIAQSTIAAR